MGIKVDVVYLSSDLLEVGRPAKEGETMAAQYVLIAFSNWYEPKGAGNSWYQPFGTRLKRTPCRKGEPRTGRNVLGYLDNGAEYTA